MKQEQLWNQVATERERLAELLEPLQAGQWNAPSLCQGWRVRDVVGHVMGPVTTTWPRMLGQLLRAGGSFNRMVLRDGQRRGEVPVEELLDTVRRNIHSRHRAPGAVGVTPLMDLMVHTQDIAIPLGIEHHMPSAAARDCADLLWKLPFPFRARHRLAGLQLRATDVPWTAGDGLLVEGPMEALLLLLSGRTAWLDRLAGPGRQQLVSLR